MYYKKNNNKFNTTKGEGEKKRGRELSEEGGGIRKRACHCCANDDGMMRADLGTFHARL
jgi:hypothetical protein